MSLRHSILGLLAGRPMTGYEIKKIFDDTLAHAWNAHDSQIYPALHRMEDKGLITVEPIMDGRRQRRVNKITEAGRAELQNWISRDDFLLRVFLFGLLTEQQQLTWLESEQKRLEAELDYADQVVAHFGALHPKSERGQRLLRWQLACIDLHVAQVDARLEWLRSAKKAIGDDGPDASSR
jgi:DNA-binding PadR family transcriptional regulator